MQEYELSVILPARNEIFLKQTIDDILKNKRGKTEIIVVLDGLWADPAIPQHPDVNVIYVPESIGQRSATNLGAKLAKGNFIMKLDSHCSWDDGYDQKMIDFIKKHGNDVTVVGIMRNLWAFSWKCYHCGWKKYQSPTPEKCPQCGKSDKIRRKMMWVGKERPQSYSYCFDSEPHFQYFEDYKHRKGEDGLTNKERARRDGFSETMSLQGSCWMMSREKYLEYMPIREEFGSWGNEGLEMACREWLSGGKVLVNHKTWYAHMFRTQGGSFGFPYPQSGREVQKTKNAVWEAILNKKLPNQKYSVSWLIKKFMPTGWDENKIKELK